MSYIELLRSLIAVPSLSRSEDRSAALLFKYLTEKGLYPHRVGNNVLAETPGQDSSKPTLLLCSHHDTVPPAAGYTFDPFAPFERDGRIYGLGSNDAGGSVVSLTETFLRLREATLPVNLKLALVAEEECSGAGGLTSVLPELGKIDMALVGEPTGMKAAVGERGLVVLDCVTEGRGGHAARDEGVNAIYGAMEDIGILRNMKLPVSPLLGKTKITVTQIEAGSRHNVIPGECRWVVDIRTTDALSNEDVVERIRNAVKSHVAPRSTRLRASALHDSHILVQAARDIGLETFVSQTMSDMTLMPFPSLKIGPGDSARSHSADEYIELKELHEAPEIYSKLILALGS